MPKFKKVSPEELDGGAGLPDLSEMELEEWVGPKSLQRGRAYAREGRIFNPRRTGQTLRALCHGSQGGPYRVAVTLTETGFKDGDCSCPVGDGGRCKHAAAMLLVWFREPESFVEVRDAESVLAERSKEELLALIGQMVARHPDLETLIELPVPSREPEKPVKVSWLRNQVRTALAQAYDEWREDFADPARELEPLLKVGEGYITAQAWHNAATVFETIAREVLDVYHQLYDDEGHVQEVVNRCVTGLGICLNNLDDPVEREPLLNTLFFIRQWDIAEGGIDMGYEAAEILGSQSSAEEKKLLAKWVRGAAEGSTGWARQAWGALLLNLEADTMDDESFLRLSRKMGRTGELVERLLTLGRVEEALKEARRATDMEVLPLATHFVAQGHTAPIVEEMQRRATEPSPSRPVVEWLRAHALQQKNSTEALRWTEQLFWATPTLEGYQQIETLATSLDRWVTMRPGLLVRLMEQKRYKLLTQIYLHAGEARQALDALALSRPMLDDDDLPRRVARLAEKAYPVEAQLIYLSLVERLIGQRNRQSYATAASYLVRVKSLHQNMNQPTEWQRYITDLRAKHHTLRALQQELGKAGL